MMKKLSSLKSFKSLKSIKLPESLHSLKSLKIEFDKTKAAKAASSVVLFGFSGWFLWHTFLAVPEPTLPPSLPQAVATITPAPVAQVPLPVADPIETEEQLTITDPDEITDELLAVTDMQEEQVDETQNQILQDTQQALTEIHDPVDQQLAVLCDSTDSCVDDPSSETIPVTDMSVTDSAAKKSQQYALTARSNLDARECLNLTDNMAIHHCAENYR
jgi:hypothetical protein